MNDAMQADTSRIDACSQRRYAHAVARLREAGITTRVDEAPGAREYVQLRARWQPGVAALTDVLAWRMEDVDPAFETGTSWPPDDHRAVGIAIE